MGGHFPGGLGALVTGWFCKALQLLCDPETSRLAYSFEFPYQLPSQQALWRVPHNVGGMMTNT